MTDEELQRRIASLSPAKRKLLEKRLRAREGAHAHEPPPTHPALVALQPRGSRAPLFCVHPIMGMAFVYSELARCLNEGGAEQPVYGLQSIGMDGSSTPLERIDDMASRYLEAIRLVRPHGPYCLAGWSYGSWVAYEMARRLESEGEEVALLALIDTAVPLGGSRLSGYQFVATAVVPRLGPWIRDYAHLAVSHGGPRAQKLVSGLRRLARLAANSTLGSILESPASPAGFDRPALQGLLRVYRANLRSVATYRLYELAGPAVLLRTGRPYALRQESETLGWERFVRGGLELRWLPGEHMTVLRQPHVRSLALALRTRLEAVALRGRA